MAGPIAESVRLATKARIHTRSIPDSGDDALALVRSVALDPSVFDETPPFLWESVVSNNSIDFYGTRMHETTLNNFVQDFSAGLQHINSHQHREFLGMSVGADLVATGAVAQDGVPVLQVRALHYTVPGSRFADSMGTDDFIRGVRAGILRDVSIGFWAYTYECSICKNDVYGMDCWHIPGWDYAVTDDHGDPIVTVDGTPLTVRAFAWVIDGHASESSTVYDGATDGCAAIKARWLATRGELPESDIQAFEQRFRIALPRPAGQFAIEGGHGMSGKSSTRTVTQRDVDAGAPVETDETAITDATPDVVQDREVTATVIVDPADETRDAADTDTEPEVIEVDATAYDAERSRLAGFGITLGTDPVEAVRTIADAFLALRDESRGLRALAADGQRYRDDLIEDALAEGVRSRDGFPVEEYREMFAGMKVDHIRRMRDDWKAQADLAVPHGRRTKETGGTARLLQSNDPTFAS